MNAPPPPAKTLLFLSQTFVPDPASVGQHTADVAVEMARRGYPVRVYASANGYDDPTLRYPLRENLAGVDIRRLRFSSFGKRSILTRIVGTITFMGQCAFFAMFTPNLGGVFVSTSPPLIGAIGSIVAWVRRVPLCYWAMDLNPDQLIAMNKILPDSLAARALEAINRHILRRADLVVALDRFMAERLAPRADLAQKLIVMPPWPHEDCLDDVAPEANPFRAAHGLAGKRVVMYSGNHSPANPLDTLLNAAIELKNEPTLRLLFVGGGVGKKAVESFVAENKIASALCLPYQPMASLKYSLTAADVHVVSLGPGMAGIIHPCKIYGAMAAGKPVLYLGPAPSHILDLMESHEFGWHVHHGDVAGMVGVIRQILQTPREDLEAMGRRARQVLQQNLSQSLLCGKFCDKLEAMLRREPVGRPHSIRRT